jgi:hypothetical protein
MEKKTGTFRVGLVCPTRNYYFESIGKRKMKYKECLESIQTNGFDWALFRNYFPFGDISLREGNYQRLVEAALDALSLSEEQAQLIAMLDAQAAVFWEQAFVQNEALEKLNIEVTSVDAHIAAAWIQINSNLSLQYELPRRDLGSIMLELGQQDYLADKLCM